MFFRYLKADFKKTKHLQIRTAHCVIPIGTAITFLFYYTFSPWNNFVKVEAYFQVLAMGFPFLIGLFCAMLAEQELSAGSFQHMLSVPERLSAFFSKLVLLVLFGMFAVLVASILFGTTEFFFAKLVIVDYGFYWTAALIITAANIFLYVLHLFMALRFNKGVTTALGIIESLISALLITEIGNNIWMYVPAAWASRMVTSLLLKFNTGLTETANYDLMKNNCIYAFIICIITTVIALTAFGIWACRWDGVRSNE